VSGGEELAVAEIFAESNFQETRLLNVAMWQVAAFSHASPERTTASEDASACFQLRDGTGVLVVADGVGGHQSGEVAAGLAVRLMQEHLLMRDPAGSLRGAILDAIESANDAVLNLGIGAATTVAVVELNHFWIRPYHVGDSMITLVSQRGRVKWQSVGHAPVAYAIEAGIMDEDDAMMHPERHLVSNTVGQEDMSISVGPCLKPTARDTLVICSDGLSDNVNTDEMAEVIRTGPLQSVCTEVVELARQRMLQADEVMDVTGKPDDLTILACRPTQPSKP